MAEYEVVLSNAARRAVWGVRTIQDRNDLADCLGRELFHGPNAKSEYVFPIRGESYTATPLTFRAWTAVHRRLTEHELDRLAKQEDRQVESIGFLVHDLLRPHTAFEMGPHGEI